MKLRKPFDGSYPVTQTYNEHVAIARARGWCAQPGFCPGGVYYYGGTDYGMPVGTPALAAAEGQVTRATWDISGYGNHVRIQHGDGYMTVYGHLSEINVKAGDRVVAGSIIGLSGNTGNSSGPHLHFEVRKNGSPVDPEPLLAEQSPIPAPQPGGSVVIKPGWYLRAGPSSRTIDLGTTDAEVAAILLETQDEWLKIQLAVWVHRDALG